MKFKDVLSTTVKVILALLVISAAIGLAVGVLAGIGSAVGPTPATGNPSFRTNDDEKADSLRTTMPKSTWERGIARAVSHHCYTNGMSEEEVVHALGQPSKKEDFGSDLGAAWTWELPPGKCLRYEGEKCSQREENHQIIFFTSNGHLKESTEACETLSGKYIYFSKKEMFRPAPKDDPCPKSLCVEE